MIIRKPVEAFYDDARERLVREFLDGRAGRQLEEALDEPGRLNDALIELGRIMADPASDEVSRLNALELLQAFALEAANSWADERVYDLAISLWEDQDE